MGKHFKKFADRPKFPSYIKFVRLRLTERSWYFVPFGSFEGLHLQSSSFDNTVGQVLVHFVTSAF